MFSRQCPCLNLREITDKASEWIHWPGCDVIACFQSVIDAQFFCMSTLERKTLLNMPLIDLSLYYLLIILKQELPHCYINISGYKGFSLLYFSCVLKALCFHIFTIGLKRNMVLYSGVCIRDIYLLNLHSGKCIDNCTMLKIILMMFLFVLW